MDFCISPMRTDLLLGQVQTQGIALETAENVKGRSTFRAVHCVQPRLGSGGHWEGEGVLQPSQRLFVVPGCPEALLHSGSLEFDRNGCRESRAVPLPLPGFLG